MVQEAQGEAVAEVIRSALERSFGRTTARAVDFYFDSRMAASDPSGYTNMLRKTFLGGAETLVEAITSELCQRYGVEHAHGMTLAECLISIRAKASGPPA